MTDDFSGLRGGALSATSLIDSKYGGWTPVGAALRDGAHCLDATARDDAAKFIVLMSDGQANRPKANAAQYAMDMAAYPGSMNIRVHTISLGNSAEEALMDTVVSTANGKTLYCSRNGSRPDRKPN